MSLATSNPSSTKPQSSPTITALLSIAKSMRQLVGIRLAQCGVSAGQDHFLLCLAKHESLSVAEIARHLSVRPSTISKMLDIMGRRGWVTRHSQGADQRRVFAQLTDAGRAKAAEVRAIETALDAELRNALGNDKAMLPTLVKIEIVLAQRLARLR